MVEKQCLAFLNTEPLWVNKQFGIQQFDFPKLDMSSFKPEPLPGNIRLGHQMEYIFKQLINHSGAYAVVLHNLPIKDGRQTIGEIDFILEHLETKALMHVELTYKFYIINPEISEPMHRLIGPNRRDMFFSKMEKIKNGQFQIVHSKAGVNALSAHAITHRTLEHEACFKAQLFVPFESNNINIRPLNKNCISGYWLRFDDFNTAVFKTKQFYIPSKSEWVIKPHPEVLWKNHHTTLMEINLAMLKENAPLVWIKKSESEFEKFFVLWW